MKWIYRSIEVLVGGLFIFSGLIKINDPVGTAIKLEEYFDVFSRDFSPIFSQFIPFSLSISVLLCALEVILGVALLVRFKPRFSVISLFGMVVFFTFLTFYSAYFNKVTDCGCFGEVIKLTPWQSFSKDVVLFVLLLVLLIRGTIKTLAEGKTFALASTVLATLAAFGIAGYAILHLPIIDFSLYKAGNHIPTLMKPQENCQYKYLMEKDGKLQEFEQYPNDKSFKFKEMIALNADKCLPKITDYNLWRDTVNFTQPSFEGRKLLILIPNIEKTNKDAYKKIADLITSVKNAECVILTGSGGEAFEVFRHENNLSAPYYFADGKVLKTMNRSNPGIVLLENGTVRAKWHYNDTPNAETVSKK